jgi:conjugative transfer signal peptidase TraF
VAQTRLRCALTLATATFAVIAIGAPTIARPMPRLIYNGSPSAPLGFYRVLSAEPVRRGDLVLARLPGPAALLAAERGYVPPAVPVLKRIAALASDVVCAELGVVVISNRVVAHALPTDAAGRALPAWHECRRLGPDEVFLLTEGMASSFDGRYFGPIRTTAIVGRLEPWWIW